MQNVFLSGSVVYLRAPDIEKDVVNGTWHEWFNDEKVTRYLVHGVYPNTLERQKEIVQSTLQQKETVLLSIVDKAKDEMCGVISLKEIDHLNRTAEISIVMGNVSYSPGAPFEAMALMTQYGFDRLNLQKIQAGQLVGLWKWVNTLELLGYKLEGYIRQMHVRYGEANDCVRMGIIAEDFYRLLKLRNGSYTTNDVMALMTKRRKENVVQKLKEKMESFYKELGDIPA